MIDESYEIVATRNDKAPHFFAEKSPLEESIRQSCRILFPYLREIVLVRDPRDYLCSANRFWKQDIDHLIRTQAIELPKILKIHDEGRPDVLFVRYEDLVLDPVETRKRLYDFIGCDAFFQPHSMKVDSVPESHKTSTSAGDSVGRFKSELDTATLQKCDEAFGGFMRKFNYTQ
jgi:Sulfotransferase family